MKQVKSSSRNGVANLFTDLKGLVTGKGKRGKSQKRGSASGKSINSKYQYRYIRYLREAKGRKEGTIKKAEDALRRWFAFTKNKTIKAKLSNVKITDFKQELRKVRPNGRRLSPGSIFDVLLQVKSFFEWLSQQPGFKSLINASDLAYFSPNREEMEYRKYHNRKKYPTLQQVKLLIKSIPPDAIISRRDRSFIAFLLLSGIRADAAVSLTLGNFDRELMMVDQNPRDGVRTKFSKRIKTVLMPFDEELYQIVGNWYDELIELGFGFDDPLFPKAKTAVEGISFVPSGELSRGYISASQMRKVISEHCQTADLPNFSPHSFRHACVKLAMDLAKDGRSIKAISKNLGHNSAIHIIDTYGQMTDMDLMQIIKSLGE